MTHKGINAQHLTSLSLLRNRPNNPRITSAEHDTCILREDIHPQIHAPAQRPSRINQMALAIAQKLLLLLLLPLLSPTTANPLLIPPLTSSNQTASSHSLSTNLTNKAETYTYQIHCTGDVTTLLNTCSSTDYYPKTCTTNCTCDCTGTMTCRALGTGQDCDANGLANICRQTDGGPDCACALAPVPRAKGDLLGPVGEKCTGTPSAGARGFASWPAWMAVAVGMALVSATGGSGD